MPVSSHGSITDPHCVVASRSSTELSVLDILSVGVRMVVSGSTKVTCAHTLECLMAAQLRSGLQERPLLTINQNRHHSKRLHKFAEVTVAFRFLLLPHQAQE
jgi:hypothetical protein